MTDYSELKRLAEAATPGPYRQCGADSESKSCTCGQIWSTETDELVAFAHDGDEMIGAPAAGQSANAQFFAAANPAAVLALIAENERIDGCCKAMAVDIGKLTRERNSFRSSTEKLKAENETLRKQIDDMSPLKGAPLTGPDLKCLACGGYHYGMSGLPCPKMAATAGSAMVKGSQDNG